MPQAEFEEWFDFVDSPSNSFLSYTILRENRYVLGGSTLEDSNFSITEWIILQLQSELEKKFSVQNFIIFLEDDSDSSDSDSDSGDSDGDRQWTMYNDHSDSDSDSYSYSYHHSYSDDESNNDENDVEIFCSIHDSNEKRLMKTNAESRYLEQSILDCLLLQLYSRLRIKRNFPDENSFILLLGRGTNVDWGRVI